MYKLTPFRFYPEKNPNEATKNLQQLHDENAALEIVEMVQMRRELEAPRASEHQIEEDCTVVHFLGVEIEMTSKAPGMVRVFAFVGRGEEGEVPVFSNVPVKGVEGIYEDEEQPADQMIIWLSKWRFFFLYIETRGVLFFVLPEAEESRLAQANFTRIISSLERTEYYNRKGARVFQSVGEMLPSPTRRCGPRLRISDS